MQLLCHFQIAQVVKQQMPHAAVVKIAAGLVMQIKTGLEFFLTFLLSLRYMTFFCCLLLQTLNKNADKEATV